jgi:hypothetical protein
MGFSRLGTVSFKREILAKVRIALSVESKYIPYNKEKHRRNTYFCVSREIKKIAQIFFFNTANLYITIDD